MQIKTGVIVGAKAPTLLALIQSHLPSSRTQCSDPDAQNNSRNHEYQDCHASLAKTAWRKDSEESTEVTNPSPPRHRERSVAILRFKTIAGIINIRIATLRSQRRPGEKAVKNEQGFNPQPN
ncbi:MAG: hypothetical protein ACXVJE_22225, partial [Mucilaginibacter sp.]